MLSHELHSLFPWECLKVTKEICAKASCSNVCFSFFFLDMDFTWVKAFAHVKSICFLCKGKSDLAQWTNGQSASSRVGGWNHNFNFSTDRTQNSGDKIVYFDVFYIKIYWFYTLHISTTSLFTSVQLFLLYSGKDLFSSKLIQKLNKNRLVNTEAKPYVCGVKSVDFGLWSFLH